MDALKSDCRRPGGFTLVENLMAMTIIVVVAIPLVGMLGMASSASSSADHRRESVHIARQIASELAHSTEELGAPKSQWCPLIAVRPANGRSGDWPYLTNLPPDLAGHSVYLAYGEDFRPAREISVSEYQKGLGKAASQTSTEIPLFAIRIQFEALPLNDNPTHTLRATVTVGSPALGPESTRRVETFATLIHVPDPGTGS